MSVYGLSVSGRARAERIDIKKTMDNTTKGIRMFSAKPSRKPRGDVIPGLVPGLR
jgi:hypothetical protein